MYEVVSIVTMIFLDLKIGVAMVTEICKTALLLHGELLNAPENTSKNCNLALKAIVV